MKQLIILINLLIASIAFSQHTFSIAAIDTLTNEIGSAGATCLDNVILNGDEGALVVSDVILSKGVIHTQAFWSPANQIAARQRMETGDTPQEIIDWLVANDIGQGGSINDRQYGVVGFVDNSVDASAYTGSGNFNFAGHRTGKNYAIQGNILLSEDILNNMESAFINSAGSLADKLMAAMQAAKVPGADQRCLSDGVSSLSAFLRVAKPTDQNSDYGNLSIDINIGATPEGIDPIDELQEAYNTITSIKNVHSQITPIHIFPNPSTDGYIHVTSRNKDIAKVRILNTLGQVVFTTYPSSLTTDLIVDLSTLNENMYLIEIVKKDQTKEIKKLILAIDQ